MSGSKHLSTQKLSAEQGSMVQLSSTIAATSRSVRSFTIQHPYHSTLRISDISASWSLYIYRYTREVGLSTLSIHPPTHTHFRAHDTLHYRQHSPLAPVPVWPRSSVPRKVPCFFDALCGSDNDPHTTNTHQPHYL